MTLHQLQYFEILARTQHYQRTAELLGISQPTLSRAINSLELELGTPLFERQGRNVVLSRFGRIFAEHIFSAMQELNTGIDHVRELLDPEKARSMFLSFMPLRIFTFPVYCGDIWIVNSPIRRRFSFAREILRR